jgi:hypothetical protein
MILALIPNFINMPSAAPFSPYYIGVPISQQNKPIKYNANPSNTKPHIKTPILHTF